jgi:hypothetical protein
MLLTAASLADSGARLDGEVHSLSIALYFAPYYKDIEGASPQKSPQSVRDMIHVLCSEEVDATICLQRTAATRDVPYVRFH